MCARQRASAGADELASVRVGYNTRKKLGTDVRYIEVPGGSHTDIAVPNLPAIFDFFDAHRKQAS